MIYGSSYFKNITFVTRSWKTVPNHMKSSVFLHVFNDISTYAYVFIYRVFLTSGGSRISERRFPPVVD